MGWAEDDDGSLTLRPAKATETPSQYTYKAINKNKGSRNWLSGKRAHFGG